MYSRASEATGVPIASAFVVLVYNVCILHAEDTVAVSIRIFENIVELIPC